LKNSNNSVAVTRGDQGSCAAPGRSIRRGPNLYVSTTLAARVGAQAEAARTFHAQGARTTPVRARALLMRLGRAAELRDDDLIDPADAPKP